MRAVDIWRGPAGTGSPNDLQCHTIGVSEADIYQIKLIVAVAKFFSIAGPASFPLRGLLAVASAWSQIGTKLMQPHYPPLGLVGKEKGEREWTEMKY